MRDYRKLMAFPPAHRLALFVFREVTPRLPRSERYGLDPQMRQCARSIPANLMEGCGRRTNKDFARFIDNSTGSANELLYYAMLCRDLSFLPAELVDELERRVLEVIRMLVALARGVRTTPDPSPRKPPPKSTRRTIRPPRATPP